MVSQLKASKCVMLCNDTLVPHDGGRGLLDEITLKSGVSSQKENTLIAATSSVTYRVVHY